jgi:hypothetical protein
MFPNNTFQTLTAICMIFGPTGMPCFKIPSFWINTQIHIFNFIFTLNHYITSSFSSSDMNYLSALTKKLADLWLSIISCKKISSLKHNTNRQPAENSFSPCFSTMCVMHLCFKVKPILYPQTVHDILGNNTKMFKSELKNYLHAHSFYSLDEYFNVNSEWCKIKLYKCLS